MKSIKVMSIVLVMMLFVGNAIAQKTYGKKFDQKNAITMAELQAKVKDKGEVEVVLKGQVASVCQSMGCWMKIDKGDGTSMMVKMKDHKFFLPKDISGKTCIIKGVASVKTTTVEMLKHYAEDEGKSQEYINSIKEPKTEITFEASGVVILES